MDRLGLIDRPRAIGRVLDSFRVHPAVALVGPRQCGKTTLARMIAESLEQVTFFDLERAVDRRRLETPEQTLAPLTGLVVIDEIQRQPGLFETLRVLLDRPGTVARFLLLGSSSPSLARGAAETLAGRVGVVELAGFDLSEIGSVEAAGDTGIWRALWLRGGFPRSYLAPDLSASALWRDSFVQTFLERDLPQLGIRIPAASLGRFWSMVAHYHGQVWNAAEFARSIGTGQTTARRYLDILSDARMVRVLPSWHENLKKRQVKAPKIYVRDSGLLHALLEVATSEQLAGHPKRGASFEGFGIEQVLACLEARQGHFWATHGGGELDLMLTIRGKRHGFEFKCADAPGTTRSMRVAMADLGLEKLWVVYPGTEEYALDAAIRVLPISGLPARLGEIAASACPPWPAAGRENC